MAINSKLQEIIDSKKSEIIRNKKTVSLEQLHNSEYYLRPTISLLEGVSNKQPFVISEFKRESPAKGPLRPGAILSEIVSGYQNAGASAISVLTDEPFFKGSNQDLLEARKISQLPLLRKEFILDSYQIAETKSLGADLLLLIAAILTPSQIAEYSEEAKSLGLEVILEIHSSEELSNLNLSAVSFLGINNRNLHSFVTNYQHSLDIFHSLPQDLVKISESGISSPEIASELYRQGYQGFLIGEHFMRQDNPGSACQAFLSQISR